MNLLSTPSPQDELKFAQESIAQSLALGIDGFKHYASKLLDVIPSIIAGLRGTAEAAKYPTIAPLSTDQTEFLRLVGTHSYLELREIKAFVPQGLKVTFLAEAESLHVAATRCVQFETEVLQPYVTYLAHLVSSGDALKSLDNRATQHAQMAAARQAVYDVERSHYEKYSTTARVKLGQVLDRNADWAPMLQTLNALKSKIESVDRVKIDALISQAQDYLTILHDKLSKDTLGNINPEVCQALSEGAYQVGAELEFFGTVYYWVLALQGAVNNTVDEVERVLKSK